MPIGMSMPIGISVWKGLEDVGARVEDRHSLDNALEQNHSDPHFAVGVDALLEGAGGSYLVSKQPKEQRSLVAGKPAANELRSIPSCNQARTASAIAKPIARPTTVTIRDSYTIDIANRQRGIPIAIRIPISRTRS